MAFLKKVPEKLEGVPAIEEFIFEKVKPHLDNEFMIRSRELSKMVLQAGKGEGVGVFKETHT